MKNAAQILEERQRQELDEREASRHRETELAAIRMDELVKTEGYQKDIKPFLNKLGASSYKAMLTYKRNDPDPDALVRAQVQNQFVADFLGFIEGTITKAELLERTLKTQEG